MRRGETTRERILEVAETSVLAKGFGATSIEEVIAEAGITKSGFFYHFRDKNELAREMLRRYVEADERIFDQVFGRAAELSEDPLQAFLIGLKMLAEILADMPGGHPGCLVASICYQERLFDREVVELNRRSVQGWNTRFHGYLEAIAAVHPPREPADLAILAEMLSCIIDGGIIMSKVMSDAGRLPKQILAYRAFVKLVFSPASAAAAATPAAQVAA